MEAESTARLLARAREGDGAAREVLARRYLDLLKRWAHNRLPEYARDACDTDDLVQQTLMKGMARIDTFEPRREGAFLYYLREILLNEIREHIRRAKARPAVGPVTGDLRDRTASPLEKVINEETLERYETALLKLRDTQREAVILRLEFGMSYQEIAEALGKASWNAVRMTVSRALLRLGRAMND